MKNKTNGSWNVRGGATPTDQGPGWTTSLSIEFGAPSARVLEVRVVLDREAVAKRFPYPQKRAAFLREVNDAAAALAARVSGLVRVGPTHAPEAPERQPADPLPATAPVEVSDAAAPADPAG